MILNTFWFVFMVLKGVRAQSTQSEVNKRPGTARSTIGKSVCMCVWVSEWVSVCVCVCVCTEICVHVCICEWVCPCVFVKMICIRLSDMMTTYLQHRCLCNILSTIDNHLLSSRCWLSTLLSKRLRLPLSKTESNVICWHLTVCHHDLACINCVGVLKMTLLKPIISIPRPC